MTALLKCFHHFKGNEVKDCLRGLLKDELYTTQPLLLDMAVPVLSFSTGLSKTFWQINKLYPQ